MSQLRKNLRTPGDLSYGKKSDTPGRLDPPRIIKVTRKPKKKISWWKRLFGRKK